MTKNHSIVALEHFIQATRDSGYRGTTSAIAELVDNALQAGASTIHVTVAAAEGPAFMKVQVRDDGVGMSPATLREALRFGGSSRFADRSGLGRFGMGLPNASLNQSRSVRVYTWQEPDTVWTSYLDIDEIAAGQMTEVPKPRKIRPEVLPGGPPRSESGTVVHWDRADRLDNRRVRTVARKLHVGLGRMFRHFIWGGAHILVGDERVIPIDPLFINTDSVTTGGVLEREWSCEVRNTMDPDSDTGVVTVQFSSLPVAAWSRWSKAEKQARGVTGGAGVSIVRRGREVDWGWFFMGSKRRQNYDSWWRCQIAFEPALDEAFGIAHTKQQIRPAAHLKEALTPFVEGVARELHAQVRAVHHHEQQMHGASHDEQLEDVVLLSNADPSRPFVSSRVDRDRVVAEVNPHHPIAASLMGKDKRIVGGILFAAAKAQAASSASDNGAIRRFIGRWSEELARVCNGTASS